MFDLVVLGVKIGTTTGWDANDDLNNGYYDFKPVEHSNLKEHSYISIDYKTGLLTYYDEEGSVIDYVYLLSEINHIALTM